MSRLERILRLPSWLVWLFLFLFSLLVWALVAIITMLIIAYVLAHPLIPTRSSFASQCAISAQPWATEYESHGVCR